MLPQPKNKWVQHSPRSLVLRRCEYWKSMRGAREIPTTKSSIQVQIPKSDVFSPDVLRTLMTRISAGEEL
jgi:hypothetical protein